jgi:hypothetical protein
MEKFQKESTQNTKSKSATQENRSAAEWTFTQEEMYWLTETVVPSSLSQEELHIKLMYILSM